MPPPAKRENLLVNLLFNIAIPSLILAKASTPERLGPVWGLVNALAFPLGYGIWDCGHHRGSSFHSISGFGSPQHQAGVGPSQAARYGYCDRQDRVRP